MAYRILRFLQRMQPGNGIWAARYLPTARVRCATAGRAGRGRLGSVGGLVLAATQP